MGDPLERFGGRKFVLALFSLVAGLLTHSLSPKGLSAEVVGLIVGVLGTFSAANTLLAHKAIGSAPASEEEAPATYTIGIGKDGNVVDHGDQLNRIEETSNAIGKTVLQTQQLLVNAMQAGKQS
jgi:hypothetical protein